MPNTPRYGLPYPALNDAPNVPAQLQALATAIESLRSNAHIYLDADYAFPSDGFVYLVPFVTTQGFLNNMTMPSGYRLTVPKTGTYRLSMQGRFSRAAASTTFYNLAVRKNSGGSVSGGTALMGAWAANQAEVNLVSSRLVALTAGDYLEMFATGLSGTTLKGGTAFPYNTFLSADFVF